MSALWASHFGNSYHERNRLDWAMRVPFWRRIAEITGCQSALEVGCGPGWNLLALRKCGVRTLWGVEVNEQATEEARAHGFNVIHADALICSYLSRTVDLTFTAGMLIHVPPAELSEVMRVIAHASRRYVLAVEYAADEETEIEYRGEMGRLWKRPFGELYRAMGLRLGWYGAAEGFDRCDYWLMEKT